MTPVTQARVKKLLELSEKATAGMKPWADEGDHYSICSQDDSGHHCIASASYKNPNAENDIRFISATINDAPDIARALAEAMDAISYIKRKRLGDDLPDCAERLLRAWNAKEDDNAG